MKKELVNEHLIYFLKNTTPHQRMVWLKKAFEFWKYLKTEKHNQYLSHNKARPRRARVRF